MPLGQEYYKNTYHLVSVTDGLDSLFGHERRKWHVSPQAKQMSEAVGCLSPRN